MNFLTYQIEHRTLYHYDEPVLLSFNGAHLKPRICADQRLIDYRLFIQPGTFRIRERLDFFENPCHFLSIEDTHDTLEVVSTSTLEINPRGFDNLPITLSWEENVSLLETESFRQVRQYRSNSPLIQKSLSLADYARTSFTPGRPMFEATRELNERIYQDFKYVPLSTNLSTSPEEVLATKQGVCRDFPHLMIACLRSLDLAARYVSGYIETLTPPGQPKLVGADASHAWVSVYFPQIGWIDFDPTNNQMPNHQHLTVAWGRDYSDVTPLRGVYLGSAAQTVKIGVTVSRG